LILEGKRRGHSQVPGIYQLVVLVLFLVSKLEKDSHFETYCDVFEAL